MPWPGWAVQVIRVTASVISASPAAVGSGRFVVVRATSQPGSGRVLTEVNGVSYGSVTATLVVLAVSDSVGTRKETAA